MCRLIYFKEKNTSFIITQMYLLTFLTPKHFLSSFIHSIKTGYSIFRNSHSACDLIFFSEIAFIKSPKSERDGMVLLT